MWGTFRLIEKVGQGSFGEVYRAFDTTLEREVALKLLRPQFNGEGDDTKAVLKEARLLARVRHPNVVPVHGVGTFDGRVGFWSDFVRGRTLADLLTAEGRFGATEAALIGIDLCKAVSAVHAAGLLHRDIKAGNAMREEGGRIVLMDFGLSLEHTETQSKGGTPSYMAPELFAGQSASVASDVYALGVVLFQLLTAKYPVDPKSFLRMLDETKTEFEFDSAMFLRSRRTLYDERTDLPEKLVHVVETALDPDPKKRFASAGQMLAGLSEAAGLTPSRTAETTEASAKTVRSHRGWWLAAAALGIGIIAGVAIREVGGKAPTQSLAILPFVNVSGDTSLAYVAEGIPQSMQRDLSGANGLHLVPVPGADAFGGQAADTRALAQKLKVQRVLTGVLKRNAEQIEVAVRLTDDHGKSVWDQSYSRPSSELIALEEAISGDLTSQLHVRPTPQKYPGDERAYDLYLKGLHRMNLRTIDDLRSAILLFQEAAAISPDFALAWAGTGEAYALVANFGTEAPLASLTQAKTASLRARELDAGIPEAHTAYGFALAFADHNLAEAERSLRKSIALNASLAEPHEYLAVAVLAPLKRFDEAMIEIQRARNIAPASSILRLVQIQILYLARRYDAALNLLEKVDPGFLPVEVGLEKALNLIGSGRPDEAITAIQSAVPDISEKWLRKGAALDQTQLTLLATLAYAWAQTGKAADADRLSEYLDRQSGQTYVSECVLAVIDIGRSRMEKALGRLEHCVADKDFESLFLPVDQRYDPLRAEPRFVALLPRN